MISISTGAEQKQNYGMDYFLLHVKSLDWLARLDELDRVKKSIKFSESLHIAECGILPQLPKCLALATIHNIRFQQIA